MSFVRELDEEVRVYDAELAEVDLELVAAIKTLSEARTVLTTARKFRDATSWEDRCKQLGVPQSAITATFKADAALLSDICSD